MQTAFVFVGTESYAVGLAAALASVARHTRPCPRTIIIDAGLSAHTRAKLEQVGGRGKRRVAGEGEA